MSIKTKYLKEEDLKKFDKFIQDSLNRYFYVDTWDKLISNTGKYSFDIISYKSTIPDLIIYNKAFNKTDCFIYSNKNSKYIKFPRVRFLLRPKKFKNYNPSRTYQETKNKNLNSEDEKILDSFEFKSIPKEIEEKFINNDKNNISEKIENNNILYDELKDFMKNDNENDSKIIIIDEKKEEMHKDEITKKNININKDKIDLNKINYIQNKTTFNFYQCINNNIGYNNKFDLQKMKKNFQFQIYLNKVFGNIYNLNSQANKIFNHFSNENNQIINNMNNNNKIDNKLNNINYENKKENDKSNNFNTISYYNATGESDSQKFEKLINNMEEIFNRNKYRCGWKVIDIRNNVKINDFNNEQLYYFLKVIIERNEDRFYSIRNIEYDILFNPIKIYDELEKIYQ